ncbi:MAG: SOS-response transcriptional repressor, LexA [Candidatus Saccharibacteria bacterium]|nr:SOS-response transcriptional repressor, LexA [Candidatus Saccharibacteria bacterium]
MAERSTKRQKELLDYVDAFIQEHGYGPSYREIMNAIGYKSVSTVAIHIDGLIQKGFLRKTDNSARSLEVVTTNAITAASSKSVSPAKEKWLVDAINDRFNLYHHSPNQMTLDELYVLIGALKILGLDGAHEASKAKLVKLR